MEERKEIRERKEERRKRRMKKMEIIFMGEINPERNSKRKRQVFH